MKVSIYNDSIGYVTDEVSTVKACEANLNEENRIKFVTDLAAISRGKSESNNPAIRYKQLLKEAALNTPSRPLEFLGIVLDCQIMSDSPLILSIATKGGNWMTMWGDNFLNSLSKFSYVEYNKTPHDQSSFKLFTNMRACLNAGIDYEDVPYNTVEELKDFKAIKAKIPMFVFNHLITHTALSKEARSERMVDISNVDYWLPNDLRKRTYNVSYEQAHLIPDELQDIFHSILSKSSIDGVVYDLIHKYSQHTIMQFLKFIGYKQEIYQRAMLEFRYKEMLLVGWYNDSKVWKHLFLERNAKQDEWKNWTQEQTSIAVNAICSIVENQEA
jgi:hypothetical protein